MPTVAIRFCLFRQDYSIGLASGSLEGQARLWYILGHSNGKERVGMTLEQVIRELAQYGTAQNVAVYTRHGVTDPMFGVSYANLGALKRRIKINHPLALELWATGNHDARVLATMIADPEAMDAKTLDAWVKTLSDYITTDAFAKLAARTSHARKKADRWIRLKPEYVARAGWSILGLLALNDLTLPDSFFQPYLEQIAQTIHTRQNRAKEAMNNALIAIGTRSAELEDVALEIAARIGKVEVEHGLTNCKTPDATQSILKTVQKKGFVTRREPRVL
jgi:3-methyladenine DNA glycosylase AlkD